MFTLHPRLAGDTVLVLSGVLSQVRLMRNRVWPWLVLVPARPDVLEIHELAAEDRQRLMDEIAAVSEVMTRLYRPDKLNVAAIDNLVPQLHVHVVARWRDDPAWPNPVWGSGIAAPYAESELAAQVLRLRDALARAGLPA